MNIHKLFQSGTSKQYFTSQRHIPTQLKMILETIPEYQVHYVEKVQPKPQNIRELMRIAGLQVNLRGRGFTRKFKGQSKARRQMAKASRRKNR
jgi:hypothetical protein